MGVAAFLGGGIFCMHFTGMSALTLKHGDRVLRYQYDVIISICSLLVAILFTYVGLRIASNDVFYKAHQTERITHVTKSIAKSSSMVKAMLMIYVCDAVTCASVGLLVLSTSVGDPDQREGSDFALYFAAST